MFWDSIDGIDRELVLARIVLKHTRRESLREKEATDPKREWCPVLDP